MDKTLFKKKSEHYIGRGISLPINLNDTIISLIENQERYSPKTVALRFENDYLTYAEMIVQTNRMANYLISCGLVPNSAISIYLPPSIEMVICILAVLKLGCYYIPFDISYPIERIHFMLKDSDSRWIITNNNTSQKWPCTYLQQINLDHVVEAIQNQEKLYQSKATGSHLAYMIYTSGSTGVPKGVKISHKAVLNHMVWMISEFRFNSSDKILLKTPLSFDPSVWELFIPLIAGGELIIAPAGSHIDPGLMIRLINKHQITIIQMVPSILKLFLNYKRINTCHSLKKVFVGGESLRPEIKELFFHKINARLINLYGPTEATINISFHEVLANNTDMQNDIIGKPIANTSIYLVNSQGKLTCIGEVGEIYIGSLSTANGYHKRESLTKEHFLLNDFESKSFKYLYKTGDLARWLPTGDLEYIGRNNDQVKINGVRIEPKEIVLTILKQKEVADCIVIKKTDSHGHDYLACYLIHKPRMSLDILAIKKILKQQFPVFMLPKVYIPISKIPLSVNGKVDVDSLPLPNFNTTITVNASSENLTALELDLLSMWQMVLEVNQVGIQDDFFDVGGGSLLALKLLTLIHEKFQVTMDIRDLFSYPTVMSQAQLINKLSNIKTTKSPKKNKLINPIICLQPYGTKTPLFLIHPVGGTVFWFSHLAKLLGNTRPIYGIQDPSIDLKKIFLNSIEEMAEFYLASIKKIVPQGPYLIGGASFGATVAVEISRQLSLRGEDAHAIFVLDGWGVYPNKLVDDNYFRQSMLRQHNELKEDFKRFGIPSPDILFEIQWYRLNLLWKYHLDLIEHPLVLFKAMEIMPAFAEIDAPFNHWEHFTKKAIHTILVPGNHETMFQDPHVEVLVKAMALYFDENTI